MSVMHVTFCQAPSTAHSSPIAWAELIQRGKQLYEISRIEVSNAFRNRGYGSLLLRQITDAADVMDIRLRLWPAASDDGMALAALIAWYERNGFAPAVGQQYLVRLPRQAK